MPLSIQWKFHCSFVQYIHEMNPKTKLCLELSLHFAILVPIAVVTHHVIFLCRLEPTALQLHQPIRPSTPDFSSRKADHIPHFDVGQTTPL